MDDTNSDSNARINGGGPVEGEAARHLSDRLLADAGLTAAEARLYRAFLDLPDADTATLAWRLDLPSSTVDKLLRRLARRGFVTRLDAEPPLYQVVDPTIALHLTVARRERSLLTELIRVGKVSAALPTIARAAAADRRRRGQPDPPLTLLDRDEVARVRADLATTAQGTLRRIVTSADAETPTSTAAQRRTIYRRGVLDDDDAYQQARRDAFRGEDIRFLPDPAIDLLAADEHSAVLARDDLAVLLHPSPLLDLTLRHFDLLWERAIPLSETPAAETNWRIGDDDAALLRLLAAGSRTRRSPGISGSACERSYAASGTSRARSTRRRGSRRDCRRCAVACSDRSTAYCI